MNIETFHKPLLAGCLAVASVFCVNAASANSTQTSANTKTQYNAAMKHCDSLKGNDKDVCKKEAKAKRDNAHADAKAAKKKAEAKHEAVKQKRDSAYGVAKEKCDAMSGDAKDACIAQAKTKYGK